MPKVLVSMTTTQQRALERKIRLAGHGSIASEIRNAIDQYLAGPKQIEAAFLTLLKDNAPKGLPALQPCGRNSREALQRLIAPSRAWRPANAG